MQLRFSDFRERAYVLRGSRGKIVNQGVGVLENMMNEHCFFANRVVDFRRQDTGVAFGISSKSFRPSSATATPWP